MTFRKNEPEQVQEVGAETLVVSDGGAEWCLLDEPRLQTDLQDWGRLEGSTFRPTNSDDLVLDLECSNDEGNGKVTLPAEYHLHASGQFRAQLKNIFLADPSRRPLILAAIQEAIGHLSQAPLSESRFEFELPGLGWQVRSTWPLPLVIHFAVDQANRAVFLHQAKDSDGKQ